ncbi:MAG TPA: DedA family protein [Solirubrobacteraceae bacterium]|jgi:membrane protein DedA with SNARE-associated domain|nr:DedA family protein [Solirubrobacteraceae bacterium]
MIVLGAIISVSSSLGYLLPALVGLESLGIPSPGETALILAAGLASQGKLQIWLVILIAVAAAIVGDNIGYAIGRKLGREVLEAPGPFENRRKKLISAGDRYFDRWGSRAVFFGRWVSFVRVVVAWMAGILEMPFPRFFFWNALGGITWATTVALVIYFGGKAAKDVISKVGVYGAIAIGVALVVGLIVIKIRERRQRAAE